MVGPRKEFFHHPIAATAFLVTLGAELLLVAQIVPDISNQHFHDFMLISMGLGFIPVVVFGMLAIAAFGLLVAIANGVALAFLPVEDPTIGEIAARNSRQRRPK